MKYTERHMTQQQLNEPVAEYHTSQDIKSAGNIFIDRARQGISFDYALALISDMKISLHELSEILHVSIRTLHRIEPQKLLDTDNSVKIIQLSALRKHGVEVFGADNNAFADWLRLEIPALGGKTPLSYLDTPFGFDIVHQLLGRIEHGIFA